MKRLSAIAEAINNAGRVLICGHVMPDGDSIGSILAMGTALKGRGKQVTMAGPDPVPEIYSFLPGAELFLTCEKPPSGRYDLLIILDCSVPARLGESYQGLLKCGMMVVSLDHHIDSEPFAMLNYLDCKAAATGEIVFDLLELMEVPLTGDIATCLYTSIVSDTGSFQYGNTTPETHHRVARLIEGGVSVCKISTRLFEEKPLAGLRLLGCALNTLHLSDCGRVAWMTVSKEMLDGLGVEDGHTGGLVSYTRVIQGVKVGVLFLEKEPGKVRISFRSKDPVDVSRVAHCFGGGGHSRAAGCVQEGSLPEVREKVINVVLRSLRNFS